MTGKKPDELENPHQLPLFLTHIWNTFLALTQSRQVGMALNPILYSEIEAYCRLTHTAISKYDLSVIKRLDNLQLRQIGKNK